MKRVIISASNHLLSPSYEFLIMVLLLKSIWKGLRIHFEITEIYAFYNSMRVNLHQLALCNFINSRDILSNISGLESAIIYRGI